MTRHGCELPDGDFALVGEDVTSPGNVEAVLIRTDALGRERWRRTYHYDYHQALQHIQPTPDGGYLATGYVRHPSGGGPTDNDWLVLKLDSAGTVQWQQRIGGPYNDGAGRAVRAADGGYLIAGALADAQSGWQLSRSRAALVKFDAAGTIEWQRRYGPSRIGAAAAVLLARPDGSYVLAGGLSESSGALLGPASAFALGVCAEGDSLWWRSCEALSGPDSDNYLRDFVATPDGSFAGTGFVVPRAPDTGMQDVWLFQTDSLGYLQAGGAPPTVSCRLVGLPEPAAGAAEVEVWPNPAPDGRYTVQASRPGARYEVRDALGRPVVAGRLAGTAPALDLRRQAAGVYALRLSWPDGRAVTRRLVRW